MRTAPAVWAAGFGAALLGGCDAPGLVYRGSSFFALLVLTFLPGSLAGQASPLVDPPACYDVHVGEWSPDLGLGADSIDAAPPSRVLLTDSAGPGSWSHMTVAPRALPSVHADRRSGWMGGPDSVALVWSTGFSGLRAVVRGSRDHLEGKATTFQDYGPDTQTAPIALDRVDCASEPHVRAEDDRPLPDSVGLTDGTVLRLGGPMPEGPTWEPMERGNRMVGTGEVVGLGPAGRIEVRGDDRDRVTAVYVTLSRHADYDALARTLEDRLGAASTNVTERDGFRMESHMWGNRTVMVWLRRDRPPGQEAEVTFSITPP